MIQNNTNESPAGVGVEKHAMRAQSVWVRNTGRGGAALWLLQRITGIFIVLMILIHIFINHFVGTGQVTYEAVMARLSNPLWKCFDLAFLAFALSHGFAGLWVFFADYINNHGWRLFIISALVLAGGALGALGAVTILGFPFK